MSEQYVRRVARRAQECIDQRRLRLPPDGFEIRSSVVSKHGTGVLIELIPEKTTGHWICDDVLTEIVDALNAEFENDRHYAGIEFEVSAEWVDGIGSNIEHVGIGATVRVRRSDDG